MNPGLFDLPAPLLHSANAYLVDWTSPSLAIFLWAVIGAIICMEIYRKFSPQKRILQIKQDAASSQHQLAHFDGTMEEAWPLLRNMLSLSFRRVAIVLPATLISACPIIVLLVWLSNEYSYQFPAADEVVTVNTTSPFNAQWIPGEPPQIQVEKPTGNILFNMPLRAPVPSLHKPVWWNTLVSNPAGYLPESAPVEEITFKLPEKSISHFGPPWMRSWEFIFIPALFIAAFAYKFIRGIQ